MFKNYVLVLQLLFCVGLGWSYDKVTPFQIKGIPHDLIINTDPFIKIGDGYYYFEKNLPKNWYEAYEHCRRMDSDLITFETVEEWDAIVKYLNDQNERRDYWTSGNDLANTRTYNWFTNAQTISINKWAPRQPDNAGNREHCIHLGYIWGDSTSIELNDRPCNGDPNSLFRYICEAPLPITVSFVIVK